MTTLSDIHDELEPYGEGIADWDWAVRVVFARAGEWGVHRVLDAQWSVGNGENTINLILPTAAVWLALVDLGYASWDPRSTRPSSRWPGSRVFAGVTLRKLCAGGERRRDVTREVWSEMRRRRDDE